MPHIFVSFKNFKQKPAKEKWKLAGKILLYLAGAAFLFVVGMFIYFAKDLPDPNNLNSLVEAQSTKIYDRTGTHLLYEIHGEENRTVVPFSDVPDTVKYATISLEDQSFYTNQGVELTSILRAGLADILHGGATQGGSTITQQLVKQTILSSKKTITRKIKEAILAIELTQKFSKDQILGMYLNTIPYGSNAYGIEAAAETFFGVHAKDLTLDEAALLASLPQAPTYYSPYGSNLDALKARQEYALDQMAKLGYITQDQASAAKQMDVFSKLKPDQENISAPHFVMYVKQYLEQQYGEQALEQGGLNVITTLNWDDQQAAEQAVEQGAAKNIRYNASNAALVAIDPKTGQILAMVGSKNYFDKTIDGQVNVAVRPRQPGSSFKPYVYLTAFEKGFTPETQLWDVDTDFSTDSGQTYDPKNYDLKNHGLVEMQNALAMSLNVPAVKTLYLSGLQSSIATAKSLGITTLNDDPSHYGLSLVLGGGEVTLLDHTTAYASLADDGVYHPNTAILKITDAQGNVLEQYKDNPGKKVVDEKYIAMLDSVLSNNDLRAPVFGANSPLAFPNGEVAAKTGTTNDFRDGWTMGYTPSIAVGVWTGNDDNAPMVTGADGVVTAGPIWRAFMNYALKNSNTSGETFPKYDQQDTGKPVLDGQLDSTKLKVCKLPNHSSNDYCLATSACPSSTVSEKKFTDVHSILYYVNKDDPQGPAPADPSSDPQYKNWEKAVQDYVKKNGGKDKLKNPAPTEECQTSDFKGSQSSVDISSPSDGDTITSSTLEIKGKASAGYGIDNVEIDVNGQKVSSTSSSSFDYTYNIPPGTTGDIPITVTVTDSNGDSGFANETVTISPASPAASGQ